MRQTAGLLIIAMLLSACALPAHNNTLIFATKTDVGIGVSTPSATDAGVSVTLGYKERRAAWVPLWANKGSGMSTQAMDCVEVYAGAASSVETIGKVAEISCRKGPKFLADDNAGGGTGSNARKDAYSTFASFGGDFGGSGNTGSSGPQAQASGRIASFFATGVAAQALAENAASVGLPAAPAKNTDKPAEPPPPAAALQSLLTDTRLPEADKGFARKSCTTKLVTLAQLQADLTKKVNDIPPKTPKDWVSALLDMREELGDGLTVMNFMAAKLKAERDALAKDETQSPKVITEKVCGPTTA